MPDRFFNPPLYLQLRDTQAERIRAANGKPAAASPLARATDGSVLI